MAASNTDHALLINKQESHLHHFFRVVLGIQPQELRIVLLFFAYIVAISAAYTMVSTSAITLFVSRLSDAVFQRLLPWSYISIALSTVLVTWCYQKFIDTLSRITLITWTTLFFIGTFLLLRLLITSSIHQVGLYFFFITWTEACLAVLVMVFFSFLGDYFDIRSARRLYGYIAGGIAVGFPIGGFGSTIMLHYLTVSNLVFVSIFLLGISNVIAYIIWKIETVLPKTRIEVQIKNPFFLPKVFSNPYFILIFLIGIIAGICTCIEASQFFLIVHKTFDEKTLGFFMGKFFGAVGITQLVIDFVLAAWLLRRFGVLKNLLLLPILFILCALGFIVFPILFFASALRFVDLAISGTLCALALQMLFLPMSQPLRVYSQATFTGIMAPIGTVVGGAFLIWLSYFTVSIQIYPLLILVLSGLWIVCVLYLFPLYRTTLAKSLRNIETDPFDWTRLLYRLRHKPKLQNAVASLDPAIIAELNSPANAEEKSTLAILEIILSHKSETALVSAYHALRLLPYHAPCSSAILPSLKCCQKQILIEVTNLMQVYQETRNLPVPLQSLFADALYFYTSILFALFSLQYGIRELMDIPKIMLQPNNPMRSASLELLEAVVPRKLFAQLKNLLQMPLTKITFIQDFPATQSLQKIFTIDPWLRRLTLFTVTLLRASGKTINEEFTMTTSANQISEYLETILFLKQTELFKDVPAHCLTSIVDILSEKTYSSGEYLFKENDQESSLFIVQSGKIQLQRQQKEIITLNPGECLGELSLLTHSQHTVSALALETSKVFYLDAASFNAVRTTYPQVVENLLRISAHRFKLMVAAAF